MAIDTVKADTFADAMEALVDDITSEEDLSILREVLHCYLSSTNSRSKEIRIDASEWGPRKTTCYTNARNGMGI